MEAVGLYSKPDALRALTFVNDRQLRIPGVRITDCNSKLLIVGEALTVYDRHVCQAARIALAVLDRFHKAGLPKNFAHVRATQPRPTFEAMGYDYVNRCLAQVEDLAILPPHDWA